MSKYIADLTATVVVTEAQGSMRFEIVSALRGLGYQSVLSLSSVAETRNYLSNNAVDWIVTSMRPNGNTSAFEILRYVAERGGKRLPYVSLFLEDDDRRFLDVGFEMGLLSWHRKSQAKNELRDTLKEVVDALRSNEWSGVLTAGSYLRKHLLGEKRYEPLLRLEVALVEHHPANPRLLLHQAEALLLLGEKDEGFALLNRAKTLDSKLALAADAVTKRYSQPVDGSKDEFHLTIRNCVVVDSDTMVSQALTAMLKEAGVEDVRCFQDGESAWNWLSGAKEPDLILMEWKIPKLNGPILLQRLRAEKSLSLPIVIVSSLVKQQDIALIAEHYVANIISKPVARSEFFLSIGWTLQQEVFPIEQRAIERKIVVHLQEGDISRAKRLRASYLADRRVSPARHKLMDAQFEYYRGSYERARDLAIESMKMSGRDSTQATNILGKSLMKLGDFQSALKCMRTAQSLSPFNVRRLAEIASLQVVAGDMNAAHDTLTAAKQLDSGHSAVKLVDLELGILEAKTGKDNGRLKAHADQLADFGAFMNNQAVALVRSGNVAKGIKIYAALLDVAPPDSKVLLATLHYNLGLAHARLYQLKDALVSLDRCLDVKSERIAVKATSLKRKIEASMATGEPLKLDSGPGSAQDLGENFFIEEAFDVGTPKKKKELTRFGRSVVTAGDLCLHQLFEATEMALAKDERAKLFGF